MPNEISTFWDEKNLPHYYKRTDTSYSRVDIKTCLHRRGIYNATLINLAKHLPQGAVVAGGFIASMLKGADHKPSDIDIFFNGADSLLAAYNLFTNPPDSDAHAFRGYSTKTSLDDLVKNSKTLRLVKFTNEDPEKLPVQLIKMAWYDNAEAVIDSFDFTVCQFAVDNNQLVFNPISMLDLFKGRLVLHRYQYPAETLYRVIKYIRKGYHASPSSILEIVEAIRKCEQMDPPGIAKMY
jgi:hypothetical protein